jgi:RND family efflux transporter MFP subunit
VTFRIRRRAPSSRRAATPRGCGTRAARADVQEAEADVRVATFELERADALHRLLAVAAPLDGIVTERNYSVGDFVRAGADGPAKPLVHVVRTDKVRIVTSVPDRDTVFLDQGDRASIKIDALNRVYEGVIARTAYAEDPETRTVRAEMRLDNPDGRLRPGQVGVVRIVLDERPNVLTIPSSEVVQVGRGGTALCFRVVDGRVVRTPIRVGSDDGTRAEVVDGLKEGDVVAATPGAVTEGQTIDAGNTERVQP